MPPAGPLAARARAAEVVALAAVATTCRLRGCDAAYAWAGLTGRRSTGRRRSCRLGRADGAPGARGHLQVGGALTMPRKLRLRLTLRGVPSRRPGARRPGPSACSARSAERVEHGRVLDGRRHRLVLAVGDLAHRAAQDLARAGLRQRRRRRRRRGTTRPRRSRRAPAAPARRAAASGSTSTPALSTTRPRGTWPLRSSCTPITAHSATAGWPASDRLHRAGREPVPGDVDDVVGAAHDEQVAVLVDVAAVAGQVVAVERGQVRRDEPVVVVPQRRQRARRQRQLDADRALHAGRRPRCPTGRGPARRSRAPAPSASPA